MSYPRKEVQHSTAPRVDFDIAWQENFEKYLPVEPDDAGCLNWRGTVTHQGRAIFAVGTGKKHRKVIAARYAYWLANGELPAGDVVCHRCDNPICVNHEHLFVGSQADNLADMTLKGRRSRAGAPGERHPNAKLTDADAARIATRLRAGEPSGALAQEYSVSRSAIYRAAKRGQA